MPGCLLCLLHAYIQLSCTLVLYDIFATSLGTFVLGHIVSFHLHHHVIYCFKKFLCVDAAHSLKFSMLFVIHFRILAGKTELASEKSLYFDFTENGQSMNQVAHGSPP